MVQASENKIQAIINTVKGLPVECKNFETADKWVGVVLELENILSNFTEEMIRPQETGDTVREERPKVPIRYAPPEDIITDSVVTDDGRQQDI